MTMNHKVIDAFTHDLPTVILGLGTASGLDAAESSVFLKALTTIFAAIMAIIPIAVHMYRNIEANKAAIETDAEKAFSNPEDLVSDVEKVTPNITKLLPKDLADKVTEVKNAISEYAKNVEDLKSNYKVDIQGYANEVAVELKKEITEKYDPLVKDVADLKATKSISGNEVISTLSSILGKAQTQQQPVTTAQAATTVEPDTTAEQAQSADQNPVG